MKILASYGCKINDETYSLSLETSGNVHDENAQETADELFRLAKETVQRQAGQVSFPKKEEKDDRPGNEDGDQSAGDGKITPKQTKFVYTLLRNNKKLFGDEATDYLKKEFKVKFVKEIPFKQADALIKRILQESAKK